MYCINVENCDYKPIFSKNYLSYYREENDEHVTILPKRHEEVRELMLNPTAFYILKLCNGENCIRDIITDLNQKYDASADTISNDVVTTLFQFSLLEIVSWKDDNPFLEAISHQKYLDSSTLFEVGTEGDIVDILNFLSPYLETGKSFQDDLISYICPYSNTSEYTELALRSKLFNFSEDFFLIKVNNKIEGIISMRLPILPCSNASPIGLIYCPAVYFSQLLLFVMENVQEVIVKDITKVTFYSLKGNNKNLIDLLSIHSFKYEGCLEKEIEYADIEIYSKLLEKRVLDNVCNA